jgi:hypothetical protein
MVHILVKIIVFFIFTIIGILILKYTEPIVRVVGKMQWAENRLGMGGTYTVWKLIGVVVIIGSLIYLTSGAW